MKHNKTLWFLAMMTLVTIVSGCHLEQGKLYFDEIGLDPITVYKMAPLERTVYCLAEIKSVAVPDFADMHASALAAMRDNPEQADWSELICLSLSGEATIRQLRQTVHTLDTALSLQSQQSNPLRGFQRIMQARLDLYDQIEKQNEQIELLKQEEAEQVAGAHRSAEKHEQITNELQRRIQQLEQQVRKLKEVELLLHPKR